MKPALHSLRREVQLNPANASVLYAFGLALTRRGEHANALPYLEDAIRLEGGIPEYYDDAARCLLSLGRPADAARAYESGRMRNPGWTDADRKLGMVYLDHLQESWKARQCFVRSIRMNCDHPENYAGLAASLITNCSWQAAIGRAAGTLDSSPDCPKIRKGFARALSRTGRYGEAIECMGATRSSFAKDAEALGLLAHLSQAIHDWDAAEYYHGQAFDLDRNHAINYFYYLIKTGQFEKAQAVLPSRAANEVLRWGPPEEYEKPRWDGSTNLEGKKVLLHTADFGGGDALQFCRFATAFQERGARVFLECSVEWCDLLATVPGTEASFRRYESAPEIDYESDAFFDLCFFLNEPPASMGRRVPYLFPPRHAVERFRSRIASCSELKLNIGLNWAGSAWWTKDPHSCRSMPLGEFLPLARIPRIKLYSLQKGAGAKDLPGPSALSIIDLGPHLETFCDTAAAIECLDLVISVDTSVAHLAGALGKPAFVLLPYNACFRWGIEKGDSDWYPTMKLFRQSKPGKWSDVVDQVAHTVREMVSQEFNKPWPLREATEPRLL